MVPSVGRIVHYTSLGDKDDKYPPPALAAIITAVLPIVEFGPHCLPLAERPEENRVRISLHILYRTGMLNMDDAPWSETPKCGHWNWPPRT